MSSATRYRIDGEPAEQVAADDRGLAYGDGVFRTLAIDDGRIVAWAFQYARLAHDCERLAIECPPAETLLAELRGLIAAGQHGVAKIMVTRGSGGRGYTPPVEPCPRRIVAVNDNFPAIPDTLALEPANIRLAEQPALAGIKHLNRLEQVWARRECETRDAADLAMYDTSGRIVATTMRNLLFRDRAGAWHTPALSRCGIAGVTRARLAYSAERAGRAVVETDIARSCLGDYEAAIACNALSGAIPVTRIADTPFAASRSMAEQAHRWLADTF
ncbi:aminodeoxychorismate lyase [uncultured Salinisphaera sp.]|uniref:aminodeoxychorismate lyase n=1 Tax=uncultured Salinisphaera sp. TaxID=359372 RepID=UPI0032B16F6C